MTEINEEETNWEALDSIAWDRRDQFYVDNLNKAPLSYDNADDL